MTKTNLLTNQANLMIRLTTSLTLCLALFATHFATAGLKANPRAKISDPRTNKAEKAGKRPDILNGIVKIEVLQRTGSTRVTKTIEDPKQIETALAQLVVAFPQVGSDLKPDPGGHGGYLAGAILTLHRGQGDPTRIVVSSNWKLWCWSTGKANPKGEWYLKSPDKAKKLVADLVK